MKYSETQIQGAKNNAALHGYNASQVSDRLALEFLDWYFANKTDFETEVQVIRAAVSGQLKNGVDAQEAFWEQRLKRVG